MYLRPPTESDYAPIASWIPDAKAALRWAGPLLNFPFPALHLSAALAVPGYEVSSYCLVDGNLQPEGFGQHWVSQPGFVHLGRIIVSPGARGRGIGRLLCQELLDTAISSSQAKAATLRVYRDNTAAVRLYESLGFQEVKAESTPEVLFMTKKTY